MKRKFIRMGWFTILLFISAGMLVAQDIYNFKIDSSYIVNKEIRIDYSFETLKQISILGKKDGFGYSQTWDTNHEKCGLVLILEKYDFQTHQFKKKFIHGDIDFIYDLKMTVNSIVLTKNYKFKNDKYVYIELRTLVDSIMPVIPPAFYRVSLKQYYLVDNEKRYIISDYGYVTTPMMTLDELFPKQSH